MVTITFDLDYEKMKQDGITEDDMLHPMREHAKKYGIEEISNGVFTMDGKDALTSIMIYVTKKTDEDHDYIKYLKTWILERDFHVEDCKIETIKIYREEGIPFNND